MSLTRLISQAEHIQQYYDVNTGLFARFGQGAGTGTIRRSVWGPSVKTPQAAFEYIDQLILTEVQRTEPARVLDLGCGLGASLCFLAKRAPIEGVGVTLSGVQAGRARARAAKLGLADRLQFQQGDFTAELPDVPRGQLAFSIEAFIHAASPEAYFQAAARLLEPGGTLIVCDDTLTARAEGPLDEREARWLHDFREGWFARSLVTPSAADVIAARAGFTPVASQDLTPYLELGRPRDIALRAFLPLLDRLPIASYRRLAWRGGDALQRCLSSGLIEYRYSTWRLRGTR